MLLPVLEVGALHFDKESNWVIGRAGAAVMNGVGSGDIRQFPAAFMESFAPVHIFAVHEEVLIEESDLRNGSLARQPEATAEDVDLFEFILWPERKGVTGEELAAPEQGV
jgi:hypothetical protein